MPGRFDPNTENEMKMLEDNAIGQVPMASTMAVMRIYGVTKV